ncbi:MAG: NAD(P)/FAD-dependent oxidoreductase [Bacteroidota bacterium]
MTFKKIEHLLSRGSFIGKSGWSLLGMSFLNYLPAVAKTDDSRNDKIQAMNQDYVVIVGGSYLGLAAAMTLGRSIRKTLVIDSGKPCNAQTPHAHNFITQNGEPPHIIAARAREQVMKYRTVEFLESLVTDVEGESGNFKVKTRSKETFNAKKIIFATGIKDIMPDLPGFVDC